MTRTHAAARAALALFGVVVIAAGVAIAVGLDSTGAVFPYGIVAVAIALVSGSLLVYVAAAPQAVR